MSQASQVRTYDRAASVVFLKTNERFGGLSNMAPGFPLQVNGVRIRTSEAIYQACRFPHLPDVQRKIIDEHSPMTAKMRSKPFRNDSRPDWDTVRVKIMKWCLRIKLAYHWNSFGKLLLDTGDRPIVEQSRKDDFWGAKVDDDDKLVGMNVLGRLLMELREEIKSGIRERSTVVLPPEIPDFLLIGQSIEPVGFGSRFVSANTLQGERQSDFREIPAQVETAQRSLFVTADDSKDTRASADEIVVQSSTLASHPQTIDGVRPYPEMKPSGLPWLGDLPAHWDLLRSGRVFREVAQIGFPDLELLSIQSGVGIVKQSGTGRKVRASEDRSSYKRIEPGWLGYNLMNAFFGGIGMSIHEGILSPAYAVAKPRFDICPRYFHYVYQSPNWLAEFNRESYGIMYERNRLYFDRFRMISTVVPPLDEQRLIVRFLDWHGAQTAKLIRAKKKIIALLNEQKQAIIHRAVTRGLDPNVRLKPSGIPWLGDVPEGWELKRLKTFVQNKIEQRTFRGEGEIYVALEHIESWSGRLLHRDFESQFDSQVKSFAAGDILFGKLRPYLAKVTRLDAGGVCVGELLVLRASESVIDPAFLECRIRTSDFIELVNSSTFGAKMPRADWDFIGNVRMAVPPLLDEQRAISSFIQGATIELSTAASRVSDEIALIQEFRTRLIADVVTGKLDIRALAASLPETVELEPIDDLVEGDDLDEAVDDAENEEVAA